MEAREKKPLLSNVHAKSVTPVASAPIKSASLMEVHEQLYASLTFGADVSDLKQGGGFGCAVFHCY